MPSPVEEGLHVSRYRIIIPARDVLKTKKFHCTLATVIHCIDLIFYSFFFVIFFFKNSQDNIYTVKPGFCQVLFLFRPMILLLTKHADNLSVIEAAVGKL